MPRHRKNVRPARGTLPERTFSTHIGQNVRLKCPAGPMSTFFQPQRTQEV